MLRSAFRNQSLGAHSPSLLFRSALNRGAPIWRCLHTRQVRATGAIEHNHSGQSALLNSPRIVATSPKGHVGHEISSIRQFHTTPPRHGLPFLPLLAGMLKASTILESVRIVGRVTLSVAPVLLVGNLKVKKKLRHKQAQGYQVPEEKMKMVLAKLRRRTIMFHLLLFTPVILFWLAILASLERTPLTGRWRTILLSPEEEEEIAAQLAGDGWYTAVREIVAQDGVRSEIDPSDWRYRWVNEVLRRLESTIPILQNEQGLLDSWLQTAPDDLPLPPPANHPLRARPRAMDYLRSMCDAMEGKQVQPKHNHSIPGPPYSLMLVDEPGLSNAFSYGFGPNGGGGIVVYSGFIDEVLASIPSTPTIDGYEPSDTDQSRSWWSSLFGVVATRPPPSQPQPTAEQTSKLAILLAHELSHLILSHHLETLSSWSVVMPGMLSILTDFARVIIFPATFFLGPFVNDAIANVGKITTRDIDCIAEFCTSTKQEIEADIVSARLLAYAGFDARDAIQFWEHRTQNPQNAESSLTHAKEEESSTFSNARRFAFQITGTKSHPLNETRVAKLREELQRWEDEREATLKCLRKKQTPPHMPPTGINSGWIAPYSRLWSAAP